MAKKTTKSKPPTEPSSVVANVVELHAPLDWQADFRSSVMRTNFCLALSQTMIEMLCAVADQVRWDRSLYDCGLQRVNTWYISEQALIKRGLIVRVVHTGRGQMSKLGLDEKFRQDTWKLTPAGAVLVELFKVTGIFVEADAAIHVRAKKGPKR